MPSATNPLDGISGGVVGAPVDTTPPIGEGDTGQEPGGTLVPSTPEDLLRAQLAPTLDEQEILDWLLGDEQAPPPRGGNEFLKGVNDFINGAKKKIAEAKVKLGQWYSDTFNTTAAVILSIFLFIFAVVLVNFLISVVTALPIFTQVATWLEAIADTNFVKGAILAIQLIWQGLELTAVFNAEVRSFLLQVNATFANLGNFLSLEAGFLSGLFTSVRSIVHSTVAIFAPNRPDVANLIYSNQVAQFFNSFDRFAVEMAANPGFVIDFMYENIVKDNFDIQSNFWRQVVTGLDTVVTEVDAFQDRVQTLRVDFDGLVAALPQEIAEHISLHVDPLLAQYDDFIATIWEPAMRELRDVVEILDNVIIEEQEKISALTDVVSHPGTNHYAMFLLDAEAMAEEMMRLEETGGLPSAIGSALVGAIGDAEQEQFDAEHPLRGDVADEIPDIRGFAPNPPPAPTQHNVGWFVGEY